MSREAHLGLLVVITLYAIPLVISWFVIFTAVLAALRRHDRD